MVSGGWEGSADIYGSVATIEPVEDFCYLGSYISTTGNCDQNPNPNPNPTIETVEDFCYLGSYI